MKIKVQVNMSGGLAYESKLLGLNLHVNGKMDDEIALPLTQAQFKALKKAIAARRLTLLVGDLAAIEASVITEEVAEAAAETAKAEKAEDFQKRLDAMFETAEEKAEEAPVVEEKAEEPAAEEKAEEPAEAPRKKGKKGKE